MPTYKLFLTAEQWGRICERDDEIAAELVKQQPALAAELGIGLEEQPAPAPVLKRGKRKARPDRVDQEQSAPVPENGEEPADAE